MTHFQQFPHKSVSTTMDRRDFIKLVSLPAASAVFNSWDVPSARAQTPIVRVKLSDFVQTPQLDALRNGVAIMKKRKPSDPSSWFFQAAVHGVSDVAVAAALAEDPNVANVDQKRFWNQCPHFGQNAGNFLLWHRAYLYYFERILRTASNDPTLAIPYWHYGETIGLVFPRAFALPFLDAAETVPNPLHHPERELAFAFGISQFNPAALGVETILNESNFFGGTEDIGFGGGVDINDTDAETQGRIEAITHGLVHVAVGGLIGTASGAMSEVPRAAFDPIFWVHHAMIDRLWAKWACMPGKSWGSLPAVEWFEETPWAFHDHNGQVRVESRRFFMTYHQLEYAYDDDDTGCQPLALPDAPAAVVVTNNGVSALQEKVEAAAAGSFEVLDQPQIFNLSISIDPDLVARAVPATFLVEVRDVHIDGVPPFAYDVYIGTQSDATKGRSSLAYVGTLPLFGLNHHKQGGKTIRLNATAAMKDIGASKRVYVTIQPVPLLIPATEALANPESFPKTEMGKQSLQFSGVRLVSR